MNAQYGIWLWDSALVLPMRTSIERRLAVLKSRYFTRPTLCKKSVAFNRADLGSTEELGDDLGRFGHPQTLF